MGVVELFVLLYLVRAPRTPREVLVEGERRACFGVPAQRERRLRGDLLQVRDDADAADLPDAQERRQGFDHDR